MAKYINADKLKEKKIYSEERHEYIISVAEVDWAPIADVREMKHGDWELIKKDRSKCSECGFQRNIETQFGWKFCPMCGADMGVYKDNEQIY